MIRNLFTIIGIVSILGVIFFFIRPDWIKNISSSPKPDPSGAVTKVNAKLSAERTMAKILPKDKGGLLQIEPQANGEDHSLTIVEDVGEDLPSRNSPYILVINKANSTMRYCRLSPIVKKASLRGICPHDVKFQEVPSTPGSPYQVIIWVPTAMDIPLEFELLLGGSRS